MFDKVFILLKYKQKIYLYQFFIFVKTHFINCYIIEMNTYTSLEKSLVEAKMRINSIEQKRKQCIRFIKRAEIELQAVEETVYILLSKMDNLAQEQKQKDLISLNK